MLQYIRPSFHCKCSKAISIAAAAGCIVEFSQTFRALNIVSLALCVHEPYGVNGSWESQMQRGLNASRTQRMTKNRKRRHIVVI